MPPPEPLGGNGEQAVLLLWSVLAAAAVYLVPGALYICTWYTYDTQLTKMSIIDKILDLTDVVFISFYIDTYCMYVQRASPAA